MSETALSQSEQYRSLPTVRIDDTENARVSGLVTSFEVIEQQGGLSSLELRLNNFGSPDGSDRQDPTLVFEDERDLHLGTKIALYAGDEAQPREIFRGVVSGFEADFPAAGAFELVVMAEDALQRGRLARRSKIHDNATAASLVQSLATKCNLTPNVSGLDDDLGTEVQMNESDLAFVRRILARFDADLQVVGDELHAARRADVERGTVEVTLGGQLRRARVTVDLAGQVNEVTTSGWDPERGETVGGSTSDGSLGPGSGRTGADLLSNAQFDSRSEHVGHPVVTTSDAARAIAEATFGRHARRLVVVEGTVEGNPSLRVGTHLTLRGVSARFENTYYVVSTCHRYDKERGYETDFEAECAYLANP